MLRLNILIHVLCFLFLSNCAISPDPTGNVFIPKEVDPVTLENYSVILCKEIMLEKSGKIINRLSLLKGEISFESIFYHTIQCVETKEPFAKFTIPKETWYTHFDHKFVRINYRQVRAKIEQIDSICENGDNFNIKCKEVLDRLQKIDEFLIKE